MSVLPNLSGLSLECVSRAAPVGTDATDATDAVGLLDLPDNLVSRVLGDTAEDFCRAVEL